MILFRLCYSYLTWEIGGLKLALTSIDNLVLHGNQLTKCASVLLSCLTSASSICQNVIFLAKKTFLNVGTKLFYLGIFGLELEQATVLWFFYISTLKFFQTKFCQKIKILKFGTKIVLIESFGLEFQKTNIELKISILEFVNMQSLIQKTKNFKLGAKNTLLRYFWAAI